MSAAERPVRSASAVPRLALLAAGAAALALYLWAGFVAPVVLWSDSRLDLDWARTGAGIFRPLPAAPPGQVIAHPAKPGYLLFLRAAMAAVPGVSDERSVVLVQSILLWASIAATAVFVARRRGTGAALAVYGLLLAVLRLRDSASAVMTEAISAALFLPISAAALALPKRDRTLLGLGAGAALLFFVRPNLAGVAAALVAASLAMARRPRGLAAFAAAFLLLSGGAWLATRRAAGPDAFRGVGFPILEGSAEYYWRPSLGPWPRPDAAGPPSTRDEVALARARWSRTLSGSGADVRRELVWRALHGVFGAEYYDPRWSAPYAALDRTSRIATPFLLLGGLAAAIVGLFGRDRRAGELGVFFLVMLVAHDVVFGSNPRYLLPAPALLPSRPRLRLRSRARRRNAAAAPRRGLARRARRPRRARRLRAPRLRLAVGEYRVRGRRDLADDSQRRDPRGRPVDVPRPPRRAGDSGGRALLDRGTGRARARARAGLDAERAFATVAVPAWLAAANASGDVEIRIVAAGELGPGSSSSSPSSHRPGASRCRPARGRRRPSLPPRASGAAGSTGGCTRASPDEWLSAGGTPSPRRARRPPRPQDRRNAPPP